MDEGRLQRIKDALEEAPDESDVASTPDVSGLAARFREESGAPTAPQKPLLNFDRVAFPKKGVLSFFGGIYQRFGRFFRGLSEFFSRLPIYSSLKENLACAGMRMEPENFLVISVTGAFSFGALVFAAVALLGVFLRDVLLGLAAPFLGLAAFIGVLLIALSYPSMQANQRATHVDRVLPFALRQLSTQVKAGVSFHRAMQSIAASDYGLLSEEFAKVAADVNRGDTMENALLKMSRRTKSRGLRRTVTQLLRSFKSGGNLSQIISDIADDVSFEVRMSIRDFTEKLNFINVIYIMVGVVAPVTLAILSAILQIPLFAGSIPPFLVYFAFVGILGVMVAILYATKRMEPSVW
ncbi:type II secretion system F family protein [Candidatus Micrarchaeota archaeon]|nr:type II secretion system F family protein [Candidatus Micrarchaeota archaeon]